MTLVVNAVGANDYFKKWGRLISRPRICCEDFSKRLGEQITATEIDVLECSQILTDCILVLLMNIPGLLVPNISSMTSLDF